MSVFVGGFYHQDRLFLFCGWDSEKILAQLGPFILKLELHANFVGGYSNDKGKTNESNANRASDGMLKHFGAIDIRPVRQK